jgi:hypothetical protein
LSSVNDSITRAMKALGHLGRTEVPTGQEFTDCLYAYNQLLESWSTEKRMSYATLQRSFSLVANTQSYTIGSGGVINVTRPIDITQAFVRDSNGQDFPLTIVSREVWNTIGLKSTTSDIPQILFYDSTYPLGVVYIYPVPTQALTVFYDSTLNQVTASTGTTSISMPPGYERCFISNLALELMANGFPCLLNAVQLSALTKAASDGIANIKRANIKEVLAACDEAIVSQPIATYNPYTNQ